MYHCFEKECVFDKDAENIEWGHYSTTNGNCSFCMETCSKNADCEAVECGGSYCSWWKNEKCNEVHELTSSEEGSLTCIKGIYFKGN